MKIIFSYKYVIMFMISFVRLLFNTHTAFIEFVHRKCK